MDKRFVAGETKLELAIWLFADALHANPAVQSVLVVQPDRNRQELGWFTYVPNPMTGVKRKL